MSFLPILLARSLSLYSVSLLSSSLSLYSLARVHALVREQPSRRGGVPAPAVGAREPLAERRRVGLYLQQVPLDAGEGGSRGGVLLRES